MYEIKDGGFVYSKGYPTIKEAKHDAERMIRTTAVGDLDVVTICEEESGEVAATYNPEIEWD